MTQSSFEQIQYTHSNQIKKETESDQINSHISQNSKKDFQSNFSY